MEGRDYLNEDQPVSDFWTNANCKVFEFCFSNIFCDPL